MEYLGEQVAKLADIHDPEVFPVDDSMIIPTLSEEKAKKAEVVRGPNIPLISQYCYHRYDPEFARRAKEMGQSIIGGENYGQGSSREHAAINPMYLGVRAVIAKSIARIHKGNLINHGIIPMIFEHPEDYDWLEQGDELELSGNELEVISCGGQLRYLKKQLEAQSTEKNKAEYQFFGRKVAVNLYLRRLQRLF